MPAKRVNISKCFLFLPVDVSGWMDGIRWLLIVSLVDECSLALVFFSLLGYYFF